MTLIAEGRYQERLNDYFANGVQRGYNPLTESTDKMEATVRGFDAPVSELVLAVTHDVNIGCFLAGRKVITSFSEETWPYYLDAAVMVERPNGSMRYGVWRWDRAFDGMDLI